MKGLWERLNVTAEYDQSDRGLLRSGSNDSVFGFQGMLAVKDEKESFEFT